MGGDGPDRQGLDAARWPLLPRGSLLPPSQHQHLAEALAAAPSAGLDQQHDPGRRAARGRARMGAGDLPDRRARHLRNLPVLSQGLARGRSGRRCAGQPPRLCGAGLLRAQRGGGALGRREAAVVHDREQGRATVPVSPGLHARRRADRGDARGGAGPACGQQGQRHGGPRDPGGPHVRGHAGSGLCADQGFPRGGGGLRPSADHGPGRLSGA